MRGILLVLFTLWGMGAFGQLAIADPAYYYYSRRELADMDWINIGDRVLFRQECIPELPAEVPTGIVFYENVYYHKERFAMSVEFRDTVIVSVTYYLGAKQMGVLSQLGYSAIKHNGPATKGQWTYTIQTPKGRTVIVGDRKRIVVVETLDTDSMSCK